MAKSPNDRESNIPPINPISPDLAALRKQIDRADHELLALLARRQELVKAVAGLKRTAGVPIRDAGREASLLQDRRTHAEQLGLSSDVIESLFRLILWSSRDRQAALLTELPTDIEPATVTIVGGQGGMGQVFARLFEELGNEVIIVDRDTKITPSDAVQRTDLVLISVPINATLAVIAEYAPLLTAEQALLDLTSTKAQPVETMLATSPAEVIGTHPLFGPSVHSLQGQRIVITPGRGTRWLDWLRQIFKARGMIVVESTPQRHDEIMAIVQVLTHFSTEVLGRTLERMGVDLAETLMFTSPIYRMELMLAARHFAQSADLYAGISMTNTRSEPVLTAFQQACHEVAGLVRAGDLSAFRGLFSEVSDFFGPFRDKALSESSYLIDRVVERSEPK